MLQSKDLRIELHTEGFIDLEQIKHYYYGGSFTSVECRYVHQLQNLYFALTGKEILKGVYI